jgi:hypothetical protein
MKVAERLRENLKRLALHPAYRGRLAPATEEQVRLTREWIHPHTAIILTDIYHIRREIDAELSRDPAILARVADYGAEYPYGLCKELRDAVLERMVQGMEKGDRKGLRVLRDFVLAGGIIQPFWGIDKGMYFQNAIQIGDAVLDAANDTVNIRKDSVILYPSTAESAITRVESFEEYADVAKKYWHSESYPNIYLPRLAPVFPILTIKPVKDGKYILSLETDAAELFFKNLFTVKDGAALGLAAHFLFEGAYTRRRLPPEVLMLLQDNAHLKSAHVPHQSLLELSVDPAAARREFTRFRLGKDARLSEEQIRAADTLRMGGGVFARVPLAEWIVSERGL